jgi:hypothetical protein
MKIIIIDNTFVPTGLEEGPRLCVPGEVLDVSADVAPKVVDAGRALYIDRKNDPSKGAKTATEGQLAAYAEAAAQAAADAKAKAKG